VAADLEHALELLAKLPDGESAAGQMEIMQKLGAIYFALEDFSRSISILETVAERATRTQDSLSEILSLFQLGVIWGRISAPDVARISSRLLELCDREKDPILRRRARMGGLLLRLSIGDWKEQGARQFRDELAAVRSHLDSHALAAHVAEYALFQFSLSDYQDSLHSLEEALPLLVQAGDIRHRFGLTTLIMVLAFSGNWGKAMLIARDAVATAQKNENHSREAVLRVYQALVHLVANDWTGALELCEAAFPALSDPYQIMFLREGLVLAGTALVGLGRYDLAARYLSQARDGMDAQPVSMDWYWRMPLQAALTELSLQRGELEQARVEARRFVEISLGTQERTWQALAWEAGARVALAGSDLQHGRECIQKAIAAMQGFDLPLAAWHAHATAMQLFPEAVEEHHRLAADVVLRLAESLQEFPQSRDRFLSSAWVRNVTTTQLRAIPSAATALQAK